MEKNEGKADRTIRLLVGLVALYLGSAYSAWWYILAAIALITAVTGWCGLYKICGWNTAKAKAAPKKSSVKKKL